MRQTNTGSFNELLEFADTYLRTDARSEVEDTYFPECDKLVVFNREDYVEKRGYYDEKAQCYDDPLADMIVAFLDFHKITECQIIGPDY